MRWGFPSPELGLTQVLGSLSAICVSGNISDPFALTCNSFLTVVEP